MLNSTTRNLFISYAREDRSIAETLRAYLKPLITQDKLRVFIDTEEIEKGEEWHKTITDQLHHADAFLFLVSQHFFRSNYVIETELPAMIKRYRDENVECWPFLVSDYPWDDFIIDGFNLAGIQAIGPFDHNKSLIPLNALPPPDQDSQFRLVYTEVRDWIEKLELEERQKQEALTRQEEQKGREKKHKWVREEVKRRNRKRQENERKRREQAKQAQASAVKPEARQNNTPLSEPSPPESGSDKATSAFPFKYLWLVIVGLVAVVLIYQLVNSREQKQEASVSSQPESGSFQDTLSSGGKGPEMVQIPAGSFMMGSPQSEAERGSDEGPQHKVQIHAFALGKTEVTFDEYDRFAQATGRELPDDEGWGRGNRPVINVSWNKALAYAQWLSEETGKRYRLPTEAEWEYAARAGTTTPFSTGECITTDQANYIGNYDYAGCGAKTGVYRKATVEAGSLPPNPWGLHEVHGNVMEWVQDCYVDSYVSVPTDGTPREASGTCKYHRVLRGGSRRDLPLDVRSAHRFRLTPDDRDDSIGFRIARTN